MNKSLLLLLLYVLDVVLLDLPPFVLLLLLAHLIQYLVKARVYPDKPITNLVVRPSRCS